MMTAKKRACTVILCLAIIFKFWLVAGMEITDDARASSSRLCLRHLSMLRR